MEPNDDAERTVPAAAALDFPERLDQLRRSASWESLPFSRRMRRIRKAQEWSHQQLAMRMALAGKRRRQRTASIRSLRAMLSRWENDNRLPDEHNRRLLAETLEVSVSDLGLDEDPDYLW